MTFAIIKTGGKQYLVSPNDKLKIEKIPGETNGTVSFSDVLLVGDEGSCTVGAPTVEKAVVEGQILRQARDKKKLVFKYHSKARYRKTKGHRQPFTEVKITNIKTA
jgi:large subunit ribosomal protein L21